jgi:hypothetical protein
MKRFERHQAVGRHLLLIRIGGACGRLLQRCLSIAHDLRDESDRVAGVGGDVSQQREHHGFNGHLAAAHLGSEFFHFAPQFKLAPQPLSAAALGTDCGRWRALLQANEAAQ